VRQRAVTAKKVVRPKKARTRQKEKPQEKSKEWEKEEKKDAQANSEVREKACSKKSGGQQCKPSSVLHWNDEKREGGKGKDSLPIPGRKGGDRMIN